MATRVDNQHKWRLRSAGYLLVSLLLFGATILAVRWGIVWWPWAVLAVVSFVLGARTGPPKAPAS